MRDKNEHLMIGKKFGRLTVLRIFKDRYPCGISARRAFCYCECGEYTSPTKEKIKKGETKSCRCLSKEAASEKNKLPYGEASFNETYRSYERAAQNRGYEFSISKDLFKEIITKPCFYCGDSLGNESRNRNNNGTFNYTGINCYDNTKGYIETNIVPCCTTCNRIKMALDVKFLEQHLLKMLSNVDNWKRTA